MENNRGAKERRYPPIQYFMVAIYLIIVTSVFGVYFYIIANAIYDNTVRTNQLQATVHQNVQAKTNSKE